MEKWVWANVCKVVTDVTDEGKHSGFTGATHAFGPLPITTEDLVSLVAARQDMINCPGYSIRKALV